MLFFVVYCVFFFFFFQAEDGIRDDLVTGVQTCALPILLAVTPLVADENPLWVDVDAASRVRALGGTAGTHVTAGMYLFSARARAATRSEERRVGKECRDGGGR